MRPLCEICHTRPRAVAYHKYNRIYYRRRCGSCISKNKGNKPVIPRWQSAGYKKKTTCDRCGFKGRYSAQFLVYHVDGDLNNCELRNLKTVCLNCSAWLLKQQSTWRHGDLEPDQ